MGAFLYRFGWLAIANGNYSSIGGWKHIVWRVWWLDRAYWRNIDNNYDEYLKHAD